MSGAPVGHDCLPLPFHIDDGSVTCSLYPPVVCCGGRGQSDLWLLGCPAGSVYSTMSPGDTEEAAEVFASLVPSVAPSAGRFAAAALFARLTSLLCYMHRTQLYPYLF